MDAEEERRKKLLDICQYAWCLSSSVLNQSHFCLFSLSVVFAKSSTTFTSVYTNYRVDDLNKYPRNVKTTFNTFRTTWAPMHCVGNFCMSNQHYSFIKYKYFEQVSGSFICHQIKVKESSKHKPNHTHLNSKHVYFISVYLCVIEMSAGVNILSVNKGPL